MKLSCVILGHSGWVTVKEPPSWVSYYTVSKCSRCGKLEVTPPEGVTKEELQEDYKEAVRVKTGAMFVGFSKFDPDFDVFTDMEKEVAKRIKEHFQQEHL